MTIRNFLLLTVLFFYSCKSKEKELPVHELQTIPHLKEYQQYALNRIIEADFDDQGFFLTDSFYLWSWGHFGKKFGENRITRTYNKGSYHYTFWTHLQDTSIIYAEDSITAIQLLKDTMIDINHDGVKDFIATYKQSSVRPTHPDTITFLSDTISRKFMKAVD